MNVDVISSFEVKPRRRSDETEPILDRKAFWLCVDFNDRERLLDDRHWPKSVMISEWYFLPPDREKRLATSATSTTADCGHSATVGRSSAVTTAAVTLASYGPVISPLPTASSPGTPAADDVSASRVAVDDDINDTTNRDADGRHLYVYCVMHGYNQGLQGQCSQTLFCYKNIGLRLQTCVDLMIFHSIYAIVRQQCVRLYKLVC